MPRLKLLEVVYEGGDVLDVALACQRKILRDELGAAFKTLDLRRRPMRDREDLLRAAGEVPPDFLLVRGLSQIEEVIPFFRGSKLFLDYLAQNERVAPGSLGRWSYRIARVFAYSAKADGDLRSAGTGIISLHPGPELPKLPAELPEGKLTLGVLDSAKGTLDVLVRLKRIRRKQMWDIDIVSNMKMGGVRHVGSPFEVAEECHLLVVPMDAPDLGGPHEGALLAMSVGRALCTSPTSGFYSLSFAGTGRYIPAERYEPGTYASSFGVYRNNRAKYDSAFDDLRSSAEQVPHEILRRM